MVLAAVFTLAAVGKLMDLEGSRRAVRDFGVPARMAAAAGLLLPVAEILTAIALVPTPTARWGGVAALALLLAFIAGIANALRHGQKPDCHCFGQIQSAPAGRDTLVRNAVLAALAVLIVAEGPGAAIHTWIGDRTAAELVAVATGICAIVFGATALWLWRERRGLLNRLGRAQRMAAAAPPGIPIGSDAPAFTASTLDGGTITLDSLREPGLPILLVFMSAWCESCLELMPKLRNWQQALGERLTIAIVSNGTVEDNQPMFEEHGLRHVLLQHDLDAIEAYRIRGTPSAVIVTRDGKIGSNPAEAVLGIEPLVRLALRDGADTQVERSVA
jgi:peroxiredoxin